LVSRKKGRKIFDGFWCGRKRKAPRENLNPFEAFILDPSGKSFSSDDPKLWELHFDPNKGK
jgi:hypothetical protein